MRIGYFQVNSFTDSLTGGNPAGVCLLDEWLPDDQLQRIAAGHELPETAFLVPDESPTRLRWFTPKTEVDLCGHATLAAAHVLFAHRDFSEERMVFESRSGELTVTRHVNGYEMNFPAKVATPIDEPKGLAEALGAEPKEVFDGHYLMCVVEGESSVRDLAPDMRGIAKSHEHGVVVTARGDEFDFVSRFFVPNYGIPEDHVTGSAHCIMAPYWAGQLGKSKLYARQVSPRGGNIECEVKDDRVLLRGQAVTFIEGALHV